MNKKGKYVDYAFLVIIGLLIVITIYRHVSTDFTLSINNYLGFLLFAIICILRFFNIAQNKYLIFILLVLYTFNIINFTVESFNMSVGVDPGSLVYTWPSINPLAVCFLIIYLFFNGSVIKQLYKETESDAQEKLNKKVDFYQNKFSECSEKELSDIFDNYAKYPEEARIALDKMRIKIK